MDPAAFRTSVKAAHKDAFALFADVSGTVEGVLTTQRALSTEVHRAIDMLMAQAYKAHSSVYVLALRAQIEDAATIVRRLMELGIQAVYIGAESDQAERLRRAGRYLASLWDSYPAELRHRLPTPERQRWEGYFESHKHLLPLKRRSWGPDFRTMFKDAGLEQTYVEDYKFLSSVAHGSPPSLVSDFSAAIVELRPHHQVPLVLKYASRYYMAVIEQWNNLFALVPQKDFTRLVKALTKE